MSRTRVLAAVAALFAACLMATPANAAAPVAGHCYKLSYAATLAPTTSAHYVSCSVPHTTKTFAVVTVPSGVDYKHITTAGMTKVGVNACLPKFGKALGSTPETRHLTAYDYVFFAPTAAQRAAGARWVRCDLILLAGKYLLPLPTNTFPVIQGPVTDTTKRCLVGSDHLYTTCARSHVYRSWAAYILSGTYRTQTQFIAAGHQRCPDAEYFTWPGKISWTAGDHVLVCYDRTTT